MNSKNKYFSSALMIENFKNLWLLMIIGFAIYFLSTAMSILSNYGDLYDYTLTSLIAPHNIGMQFGSAALAACSALVSFMYLFKSSSIGVLHAMPFSRKKLFASSYVSGLIAALLPLVVITLILIALKQPVIDSGTIDYFNYGSSAAVSDSIYTAGLVLRMAADHAVSIFFVYSVCVLGCMVAGNFVIAFLTAFALNFICPAIYLVLVQYSQMFLYGVNVSDNMESILKLNPWMLNFEPSDYSAKLYILYIAISVVLVIASFALYSIRPFENSSDNYVFGFMQKFVVVSLTFFCASVLGFIFNESGMYLFGTMDDGVTLGGIGGFVIGGLISFAASQMIAKKTFRIFNKETLKLFGLCILIIAVIVGCFVLDILGIESRVPAVSSVDHAEIYASNILGYDDYSYHSFYITENIQHIIDLQNSIIENRRNFEGFISSEYDRGKYINIVYVLNNGQRISREYHVPESFLMTNNDLRKLFDSAENKQMYSMLYDLEFTGGTMSFARYWDEYDIDPGYTAYDVPIARGWDEDVYISDKKNIQKFIELFIADATACSYDSVFEDHSDYYYVSLNVKTNYTVEQIENLFGNAFGYSWNAQDELGRREVYFSFNVPETYAKTYEFLMGLEENQ